MQKWDRHCCSCLKWLSYSFWLWYPTTLCLHVCWWIHIIRYCTEQHPHSIYKQALRSHCRFPVLFRQRIFLWKYFADSLMSYNFYIHEKQTTKCHLSSPPTQLRRGSSYPQRSCSTADSDVYYEKPYCRTSFQRTPKEGRQDSKTYISVMKNTKHTVFTIQEVHPVMQLL